MSEVVLQAVVNLWGIRDRKVTTLPCANPRSLLRADIPGLHAEIYLVGAKQDGVRTFCLLSAHTGADAAYFFDRALHVRPAPVRCTSLPAYNGTLLDGEMVGDTYVCFDIVAVDGYSLVNMPYLHRLVVLRRTLASLHGMEVVLKDWNVLSDVSVAQLRTLAAGGDGLILQALHGKLSSGTCPGVFKWKSSHTLDLEWRDEQLWLRGKGSAVLAAQLDIHPTSTYSTGVVECEMRRRKQGGWWASFVRARPDKLTPNNLYVARATLQNADEALALSELLM